MERLEAYRLKSKDKFIAYLRENGFEYNIFNLSITYPGLSEPEIANIIQEGVLGAFVIMPFDSEKEE